MFAEHFHLNAVFLSFPLPVFWKKNNIALQFPQFFFLLVRDVSVAKHATHTIIALTASHILFCRRAKSKILCIPRVGGFRDLFIFLKHIVFFTPQQLLLLISFRHLSQQMLQESTPHTNTHDRYASTRV
jgi:hypothetical protein